MWWSIKMITLQEERGFTHAGACRNNYWLEGEAFKNHWGSFSILYFIYLHNTTNKLRTAYVFLDKPSLMTISRLNKNENYLCVLRNLVKSLVSVSNISFQKFFYFPAIFHLPKKKYQFHLQSPNHTGDGTSSICLISFCRLHISSG